jgi:two-component system LytT family sensor kinase
MRLRLGTFRVILLVIAGWTVYALFFAIHAYLSNQYFGRPEVPFSRNLAVWFSCAFFWLLLTPIVYWLARRFPFEKGRFRISIPIHVLAGACVSFATLSVFSVLRLVLDRRPLSDFDPAFLERLLVADFHFYVILYFVLIGLYNVFNYYWSFREHQERATRLELEAAQLETQLAQAQLNALKMQIHPHFLFNTLNSVSVLMPDDPGAANEMLVRLSELLRVALRSGASQLIPLREELDFLRDYLAIEQTRFQDRLAVDFEVDEALLDAEVPTLILQPLVENAIRHGIAPKPCGGMIQIRAVRNNGLIELAVLDNGSGTGAIIESGGIGLKNTKERLEKLYGKGQSFKVLTNEGEGVQVVIRIPYVRHDGQDTSIDRR